MRRQLRVEILSRWVCGSSSIVHFVPVFSTYANLRLLSMARDSTII